MTRSETDNICPLCGSLEASLLHRDLSTRWRREFRRCPTCDLAFVPPSFHLTAEEERARYLLHRNDAHDPGYRAFLRRLWDVLKPRLPPGARGLDYGAGPGPALAAIMREDGFDVRVYDPFFHPDDAALCDSYDFVTCTETAEHFRSPAKEFRRLDALTGTPGWLGVMTGMLDTWDAFSGWHYHMDPTHVCFYSRATMLWIAERHGWQVLFPRKDVVLFRKG